ncbi:MAG: FMN-binding glutamate synthase family protein [Gemmatimonadota bacterium]
MWILVIVVGVVAAVALRDVTQTKHAIQRNFPIVGHFRYWLESVGPELRQYIVTSNTEERPFSRAQRRWVYASAKGQNNYFGFGTDERVEEDPNFLIIKHSAFGESGTTAPHGAEEKGARKYWIPSAKVLGGPRGRKHAFRPDSAVYVSGMSFGALSARAVEAMNRGALLAGCLHNTGEGGVGPHHAHGADLIWQLGTGYFGARDEQGRFSEARLLERLEHYSVRAIEIKLSQGAKPGLGGVLPAAKVSPEIARIRGVPAGKDCVSPARHSAFHDVDSMLDFVEHIAEVTGLPVGIKSAVGEIEFWQELARHMAGGDRGVDFITVDGGEGGTGAAPLVFADHVALPFKLGFSRVYRTFAEAGLAERVTFVGSGKLGFPENALLGFSLGCDLVAVAREAMMSIGCIQAQRCHTGHCPAGVATQNAWLMRGLDPTDKSARLANYVLTLRKELLWLSHTCGVAHPGLVTGDHLELLDGHFGAKTVDAVFHYEKGWGLPGAEDRTRLVALLRGADPSSEPGFLPESTDEARRSA